MLNGLALGSCYHGVENHTVCLQDRLGTHTVDGVQVLPRNLRPIEVNQGPKFGPELCLQEPNLVVHVARKVEH